MLTNKGPARKWSALVMFGDETGATSGLGMLNLSIACQLVVQNDRSLPLSFVCRSVHRIDISPRYADGNPVSCTF